MPRSTRDLVLPYGCAILSVVVATLVRLGLEPFIGERFPFALLFIAILFTAWYAGPGPSVLALVLAVFVAVFFIPPRGSPAIHGSEGWLTLLSFAVVGALVALLSNALRSARDGARVSADESSREREQLRTTLRSIGDGVLVTDSEGRIRALNPVAETLTGWTSKEAAGQPLERVFVIVAEDSGLPVDNPVARVLREGTVVGLGNHTLLIARDGTRRPIDDSAAPIRDGDGKLFGVVLVFRDVTERRRAEHDLRFLAAASAELAEVVDYQSTLEKVARLAVPGFADWCAADMVDADGSVRRLAVAHVDPDKVKLAHDLERRYPPDPKASHGVPNVLRTGRSEMLEEIPDALLVQGARDEDHLRLVRELGLKSYLCVPLAAHGKVLGALSFVTAESGRRYRAADLALAEDLAHRAAVALENARLYGELIETDRRKDQFLAMLAHELRNPLAPIQNALYILRTGASDAETLTFTREVMERQVQSLVRLVDDLLDVSRIMRGKVELRKERLELTAVVARAVETARPLIDAQGHELSVNLPAEPVWLEADAVRLAQVLANLLNNAAKYTPESGHIRLSAETEGRDKIILRVRDTGIGIRAEMLAHVFDLFTQADSSLGRARGGLGIGLTLVKALVELHGGSVQAFSKGSGQGSEFVVRLPLSDGAEVRHAAVETPAAAPSPSRRVLLLDDNVDAANSLALMLRLQGHEVLVAHDGPTALEAVKEFTPDIAVLDLGMPGMDGYEVARRLRREPGLEKLLLVALTGWGQEEFRRRSREAGFDFHLVKPAEPRELRELLARAGRQPPREPRAQE